MIASKSIGVAKVDQKLMSRKSASANASFRTAANGSKVETHAGSK